MNKTGKSALTLIEMVVVILILGIIATIALRCIMHVSSLYWTIQNSASASDEALSALERMRREIRTVTSNVTDNSSKFAFVNSAGIVNTFELSGTTLLLNNNMLADDVSRFALTYYDSTNGELSAVPLGDADRERIKRIAIDFRISRKGQSASFNVNLFYPEAWTTK